MIVGPRATGLGHTFGGRSPARTLGRRLREDDDVQVMDALLRAQEAAAPEVGRRRLAEYIPSLATVDPRQFGMVTW